MSDLHRLLARFTPPRALPLAAVDLTPDIGEESEVGKKMILGGIPCIGQGVIRPQDDRSNPLDEVLRNEAHPRRRGLLGYGPRT